MTAVRIQRTARAHAVRKALKGQKDLRQVPKTVWVPPNAMERGNGLAKGGYKQVLPGTYK